MVQVTFDTNTDSIEELEHAQRVIADAIARRSGSAQAHHKPAHHAAPVAPKVEETTIDTPFLKISIKDDEPAPAEASPTLNQLLEEASLSEEEMSKMFKQVQESEPVVQKVEHKSEPDASFIEIVEFDEEEKER